MNNPLPAALASIKRYDIDVYGNAHEREGGAWMAAVDVLATLPPPADGAVTCWINDEGLRHLAKGFGASVYPLKSGCLHWPPEGAWGTTPLYVAPPADSAMVEALQKLLGIFDSEIHNEYDGTSMLADRLAEADFARTLLAGRK